jgi:hypothetical protein
MKLAVNAWMWKYGVKGEQYYYSIPTRWLTRNGGDRASTNLRTKAKTGIASGEEPRQRKKVKGGTCRSGKIRKSLHHSPGSLMLPTSLISASSSSPSSPVVLLAASLVAYRCTYSAS